MPIAHMTVRCPWCGHHASICLGNPQEATKPEDSPFEIRIGQHGPELLFKCPGEDCRRFFPRLTQIPARSQP